MVKLSPEQQRVVECVKAHGGELIRLPGGFWTAPHTPVCRASGAPEWFTTVQTVRALEKKGVLVRANVFKEEWRDTRRLVPWVGSYGLVGEGKEIDR